MARHSKKVATFGDTYLTVTDSQSIRGWQESLHQSNRAPREDMAGWLKQRGSYSVIVACEAFGPLSLILPQAEEQEVPHNGGVHEEGTSWGRECPQKPDFHPILLLVPRGTRHQLVQLMAPWYPWVLLIPDYPRLQQGP